MVWKHSVVDRLSSATSSSRQQAITHIDDVCCNTASSSSCAVPTCPLASLLIGQSTWFWCAHHCTTITDFSICNFPPTTTTGLRFKTTIRFYYVVFNLCSSSIYIITNHPQAQNNIGLNISNIWVIAFFWITYDHMFLILYVAVAVKWVPIW